MILSNLPLRVPEAAAAGVTVGVRANSLRDTARPGDIALSGSVQLAEISGSDTFLHAETSVAPVVAQLTGVHRFELGTPVTLYLQPSQVYLFGAGGDLLLAPDRHGRAAQAG